MFVQPVRRRPQQRDQHIDAPETEDDRGNRGQQLDDSAKDCRQLAGQEILGQKNGDGDAEGSAENQGQQRTVERAPDLGENAKCLGLDVPIGGSQKTKAVFGNSWQRLAANFDDDVSHQCQDERSAKPGDAAKALVKGIIASRGRAGHGASSTSIVEMMRCHESPSEVGDWRWRGPILTQKPTRPWDVPASVLNGEIERMRPALLDQHRRLLDARGNILGQRDITHLRHCRLALGQAVFH